ncbi:MAG: hypothetical protein NUK63_03400 [Candidatus Bathyarchaeum tardum]|nr:MAG: hypothetical protein NUK63_03400 [Candidatus Bathyarchaeum tardum]
MPRWSKADITTLHELVAAGENCENIAVTLKRGVNAVKMKAKREGLNVVVGGVGGSTTTNDLPEGLPSVEDVLKVLAKVIKALDEPGLGMAEVQRLQAMITGIRTYKSLLADYVNYREIEKKLLELDAKYAKLIGQKS